MNKLSAYLTDGCLILDNSSLALIKSCPTMGRYKLLERRERASATAKGRGPGKALHAALETRYRRCGAACPTDEQQAAIEAMLAAALASEPQPDADDYLNATRLTEVMRQYRDGCVYSMGPDGRNGRYEHAGYRDESFEVLWVELPFAVRLGDVQLGDMRVPVIYIGRSDLGVLSSRGELLVVDHKSMRRWESSTIVHWSMAPGPKGYAACIGQWVRDGIAGLPHVVQTAMLGYEPVRQRLAAAGVGERPFNGFMLNAMVIRNVSDLRRCKEPPTAFHRHLVFYEEHVLAEWRTNTLDWCRSWLEWTARGAWPMNEDHCSSHFGMTCPYYDCCSLPPGQRAIMLATDAYTDTTWSPLNRMAQETED